MHVYMQCTLSVHYKHACSIVHGEILVRGDIILHAYSRWIVHVHIHTYVYNILSCIQ